MVRWVLGAEPNFAQNIRLFLKNYKKQALQLTLLRAEEKSFSTLKP
jgi:hypothetical protein